ncbi:palmitoyl-protein thioesterase 1 precursor [Lojkania enalia]|uniref:Palmitoyl-protein thioesterase 1 n=1 Tax=Lojkania enalia TaxID=147567 RepID=A0A9P4JY40_9PLEO|nr:palmitoyl-protein thioesterase 1 precursor [Didymosphaeria enalia]
MLRLLTLLVLLLISAVTASPFSPPSPIPLIIWHGLGDKYDSDGIKGVGELANKANPGTFVYNIRLSEDSETDARATFFGNLTEQIQQVCDDLSSHPILSTAPSVNALGFSQGGQFLRGYIQRCNKPPVKNLITFGSQHNGIAKYQSCAPGDWICKAWVALLRGNTWSSYAQSHLVPAQYYRSIDEETGEPSEEYLENSNFLADINNERKVKNKEYAEKLSSLDKFVMYMFEDDTTVIPKESAWFAQTNIASGEVIKLRDRVIYKEDWIGLKKLDEKGGLEFKTTPGGHMQFEDKILLEVFETYFSSKAAGWGGAKEWMQDIIEL